MFFFCLFQEILLFTYEKNTGSLLIEIYNHVLYYYYPYFLWVREWILLIWNRLETSRRAVLAQGHLYANGGLCNFYQQSHYIIYHLLFCLYGMHALYIFSFFYFFHFSIYLIFSLSLFVSHSFSSLYLFFPLSPTYPRRNQPRQQTDQILIF